MCALALALAPAPALAQLTGPACWMKTMEWVDNTVTPSEGGDQSFFTRVGGGPPFGYLVFANSPSEMGLGGFNPATLPAGERGCTKSTFLNSRIWNARTPLQQYQYNGNQRQWMINCQMDMTMPAPTQSGHGYDPNFTYPRIDDGCYLGDSFKTADDIDPTDFYILPSAEVDATPGCRPQDANYPCHWDDPSSHPMGAFANSKFSQNAPSTVCGLIFSGGEKTDCQQCLGGSAKEPYYIGTQNGSTKVVFSGNFLHFYGPLFLGALSAWKNTISSNVQIIWGHGLYDNVLPGAGKGRDPNPQCNKFDTDFNPANRKSYVNDFSNTPPPFANITKFPLAEAVFSIGYFLTDPGRFGADPSAYVRTGYVQWDPKIGQNQDTICNPCQYSALIVISDGTVNNDTAIHNTIKAMNVVTPGVKTMLGQACQVNTQFSCGTSLQCVGGTCQDQWWADDAAAYFYETDARNHNSYAPSACYQTMPCDPEIQRMHTYVINVGPPNNPALRNVAERGNGLYLEAIGAGDIRTALDTIVADILKRSTSFSVASVTSVQTRTTTAVFLPRFKPSALSQWEGHLYRYKLFNENAAGCTVPDDTTLKPGFSSLTADQLSRNPNGSSTCSDVYLKDADNDFVGENEDGDYYKLDASQTYDTGSNAYGWPLRDPGVAARPVWDGGALLAARDPATRVVKTAVDFNSNGVIESGEQIDFTAANVSRLVGPLGLGGVTGPFCQQLAGLAYTSFPTESACAETLIRWVRGEDVFDADGDLNYTEARRMVLLDIFHSSPVLVVPPLSQYMCDIGANVSQCARSVYSSATPGGDTYRTYQQNNSGRTQFVLVGANDGMLHAFEAAIQRTGDDPETPVVEPASNKYFDLGTGNELWAFIPPEMLPKLKRLLMYTGHMEMVDGSPMVRDIWVDANGDGTKQAGEFHTIAITGMRRGGRTWFALDVTDPATPNYLWTVPPVTPAGTRSYLMAGQSWGEFAPRPPPIVPVLAQANAPAGSINVNGTLSREEWAVFLGDGYDPLGIRGRGFHAYDAWTGAELWRYTAWEANPSDPTDPRHKLGSVPGVVGAVDWTNEITGGAFQADDFFDTASIGDMFGNIWTVRMGHPGHVGTGGLFDNWYAGRAFQGYKGATVKNMLPFFEAPVHAIIPDTKALRVYVGTGDRAQFRDQDGGVCSLYNATACMRRGCLVDVGGNLTQNRVSQAVGSGTSTGRYRAAWGDTSVTEINTSTAAGSLSCATSANVSYGATIDCTVPTAGMAAPYPHASTSYTWGLNCSDPATTCNSGPTVRPPNAMFPFPIPTSGSYPVTFNRFYSVRLFDTTRTTFGDATAAASYDTARLTDTDLAYPDGLSPVFSTSSGNGWYLQYTTADERSSGAAFVPGGATCFFSTLIPMTTPATCGHVGSDTGRRWQANAVTGGSSLETGTNVDANGVAVPRYTSQTVLTPPKTLITQKVLTPSGQIVTVALTVEPGQPAFTTEAGRADFYAPVQMLKIDRATHNCRHGLPDGGHVCP